MPSSRKSARGKRATNQATKQAWWVLSDAEAVGSRLSTSAPKSPRAKPSGRWSVRLDHLGIVFERTSVKTRESIVKAAPGMTIDRTRRRLIKDLARSETVDPGERKVGLDPVFTALSNSCISEVGTAAAAASIDESLDVSTRRGTKRIARLASEFPDYRAKRKKMSRKRRPKGSRPINPRKSRRKKK